jgi:hypothetical protein
MAHNIIEVPISIYDAIRELQDRILNYEVEAGDARAEMEQLLAPYVTRMPVEGEDTTEIRLLKPLVLSFKGVTLGRA